VDARCLSFDCAPAKVQKCLAPIFTCIREFHRQGECHFLARCWPPCAVRGVLGPGALTVFDESKRHTELAYSVLATASRETMASIVVISNTGVDLRDRRSPAHQKCMNCHSSCSTCRIP